jgi:hypothetical protein
MAETIKGLPPYRPVRQLYLDSLRTKGPGEGAPKTKEREVPAACSYTTSRDTTATGRQPAHLWCLTERALMALILCACQKRSAPRRSALIPHRLLAEHQVHRQS